MTSDIYMTTHEMFEVDKGAYAPLGYMGAILYGGSRHTLSRLCRELGHYHMDMSQNIPLHTSQGGTSVQQA